MYYPSKREFIKLAKKGNLIPVYQEVLADLQTPMSAFIRIAESKYAYLLESIEGTERIARYSFLGGDPSLVFTSKGEKLEIFEDSRTKKFNAKNPLAEIKKILEKYKFVSVNGLPRFCGGMVGYIGYDMVRCFEPRLKIKKHNPSDDLNLPDALFMLTDTIIIFDHLRQRIKIVSNAYIKNPKARKKELEKVYDEAVKKIELIFIKLKKPLRRDSLQSLEKGKESKFKIRSNFTEKGFKKIVSKAKQYIKAGDIIQVVLSQRFQTQTKSSPLSIYRALRSLNPSPYMYCLKLKDFSIIGSSPELLVRCEGNDVEVRPIAGTRKRGRDEKEDKQLAQSLINDPKEKAEHIMLVDLGRNDIGRVSKFGSVKVSEFMTIEKYSHVMHIVSGVQGKLKGGKDGFDAVASIFPAGTVTGAPKIRAMEIIDELEKIRRGPYAGLVGYFSFSGNVDTCITIRTIIVKGNHAFIQAGAGIVADSNPKQEYRETINKAKAALLAIEMAEKGR